MTIRRWLLEILAGDRYIITDMKDANDIERLSNMKLDPEDTVDWEFNLFFPNKNTPWEAVNSYNKKTDAINEILSTAEFEKIYGTNLETIEDGIFQIHSVFRFRIKGKAVELSKLKHKLSTVSNKVKLIK